jgi:hypothetical protein
MVGQADQHDRSPSRLNFKPEVIHVTVLMRFSISIRIKLRPAVAGYWLPVIRKRQPTWNGPEPRACMYTFHRWQNFV